VSDWRFSGGIIIRKSAFLFSFLIVSDDGIKSHFPSRLSHSYARSVETSKQSNCNLMKRVWDEETCGLLLIITGISCCLPASSLVPVLCVFLLTEQREWKRAADLPQEWPAHASKQWQHRSGGNILKRDRCYLLPAVICALLTHKSKRVWFG
jgi:hypothetical protein